ncbi:MAG: CDP-alcohol phosphatidyltransferase family protein [Alphaproteobacteria bacterium]|nr:CDP-alcohol phosphatidyltransferase family protein [Alphaproteobacteria bacterium]
MIESYVRPIYQKIFCDPLARVLGKSFSPNALTFLGTLVGVVILPALYYDFINMALALLVITGIFDTLDGTVARLFQKDSYLGTVFDIIGDRIVEFSIVLGLFLLSPETRALGCLLMLGSILICVTSFLVIGIFSKNESQKGFHYSPGLMERPEAFLFFAAMMLLPTLFSELAFLFTFLVFLTAVIRVLEFKNKMNEINI